MEKSDPSKDKESYEIVAQEDPSIYLGDED